MTKQQTKSIYSGEVHAPIINEKSSKKCHQKREKIKISHNPSINSHNNIKSNLTTSISSERNSKERLIEKYSINSIITSKSQTIVIPKEVHKELLHNKRKSRFTKISYSIGSLSIGILFVLGLVAHQKFKNDNLARIIKTNNNNNSRYVRSISSNNVQNMNHEKSSKSSTIDSITRQDGIQSVLRKVNNDIALLYREYITPFIGETSRDKKLHFESDSLKKQVNRVVEGEGFRLNIPSYIETLPSQIPLTNNNNLQKNNNNKLEQIQSSQNSEKYIQNEKFDQQILNFDIQQKKLSILKAQSKNNNINFHDPNQIRENSDTYLPKKSVSQNDPPLSQSDPDLSNLIKKILDNNMQSSSSPSISHDNIVHKNLIEIFQRNSEKSQCLPTKNMVFAKTHKTGGTTITNMLLRHAEKYNLDVALPIEYHWELGGYPALFNKELVTPKQNNYNLLAYHMRFNKTEIKNLINPTNDYFTILRDPVSNFESSFGFFKDYPFTEWLDENRNINDFINNAEKLYNKDTPWYFRAKNYMSFDLGFNHEDNSDEYISYVINEMEKDFKFVMITDRYEESMILLKNMLCLDYDDIVYLPLKVRTDNDRKILSTEASEKIKKWNRLDTAIYEYYSQKFEQLTVLYGKQKLAKEVKILQEKLKDVEARCVEDYDSQSLKPWIKRIKLRKPSGQKCQRMVWGEVKYADYLRQLQYGRMTEEEYSEQPPLDQKIELMKETQRQVLGDII